jgi:hypothetical protein
MPSYIVTVDGQKFKVNSDKELTSAQAYEYASKQSAPSDLNQQQVQAQNKAFPESVFGSRAINKPTTAGEMLQRQDPIAVGQIAEVGNIVGGKDVVSDVARRFGVNPQDPRFKAGQLTTDIGIGLAVPTSGAAVASKIPAIAKYAPAIASSGADLAGAKTASTLTNLGLRTGIGAGTGAITSGLINPDDIETGALLGGVLGNVPAAFTALTDRGSRRLMQSAIKPSVANLESGDASRAITTMLEEGVNPTQGRTIFGKGLDTLQKKVTNLNTQISDIIKNSKGSVNKNTVVSYLDDMEKKALMQVAPESDLSAIQSVRDQFIAHPLAQGQTIPIQLAQELKKGTYKALGGKAYGEISSASKEAQKGIARGLKEGIVEAEPAVAGLNAQESRLLNALNVSERRALMEANKDIVGLGSITPDLGRTLAFMADRNSAFKALLARMLYSTGRAAPSAPQGLLGVAPAIASGQEQ